MGKSVNETMHVVLSDQHIPYQDKRVEKLTFQFLRDHQPGTIHLLGDLHDFYQLSRFDKDPERATHLQSDLDDGHRYLARLRDAHPDAKIIYSEGNHEYRLQRYLWGNAKELAGLRNMRLSQLLHLKELDIEWVDSLHPYKIGHLLYVHGIFANKHSGYSAKSHHERFGCCVIHGHTHRLGSYYRTTWDDTFAAFENGCLCERDPTYMLKPNWQ
ncbi:MAG: hypothetical protein FJY55_15005, partial [Betaproteobacteria bacterium]|nr:hypothetical protein [Betaproteobacteria bacterium]